MHQAIYCYGDQVQEDGIGRTCDTYGETRDVCRFVTGKPEDC
jgi:hypothetical protein